VDDLLDVSRITRGKTTLLKRPLDLSTVVANAPESTQALIDSRDHDLQIIVPWEPVLVDGDPTRLAQVVTNLLSNSAKYTPRGGHIWLTVEKAKNEAVIRVRDTGIGIAASVLPKVFDLFTQGDRTLDRAEGGLGIGLTLVRRLTEMHGGTVHAFSAGEGKGSEFVVRLPLLPPQHNIPYRLNVEPERTKAATSQRVLIVDDNKDSADSLAMLLRLIGSEVRTAHDGRSALQEAGSYQPDMILLDIGLPGLSGYEVARRLRDQPALGSVILIALTGYGDEETRRRAKLAGFDHHLHKPVDLDVLRRLLATVTQETRTHTKEY
jgi:CheY-like chemotaxis protein